MVGSRNGRPQPGQTVAESLTARPQSGHVTSDTLHLRGHWPQLSRFQDRLSAGPDGLLYGVA